MSISFKLTVPSGSELENELQGKVGRDRTSHTLMLATLGLKSLKGFNEPSSQVFNPKSLSNNENKSEMDDEASKNEGSVVFDHDDLVNL